MIQLDGTIEPTAYGHELIASVVVDEDGDADQMGWALLGLQQSLARIIAASLTITDAERPAPDTAESLTPPGE